MKSFSQYLEEAFDSKPVKWKKVKTGNYYFTIDEAVYDVEFTNDHNVIEVVFSIDLGPQTNKLYNMTGTGNQFKVLSTVMDIIRSYIDENKDLFTAEKEGVITFTSKGTGRTNVYTRLVKKYLPKDWNVVTDVHPNGVVEFFIGPREYVQ